MSRMPRPFICQWCGREFLASGRDPRFCCHLHADWANRKEEAWSSGYCYVHAPKGHPSANCRGKMKRCRRIMEEYLGRILLREEKVHHKDGSRDNDAIENLEVMLKSEHMSLHARQIIQTRNRDTLGRLV